MDEPINLNAARAAKSNSAKDWSVRDALQHALTEIDSGGPLAKASRVAICFGMVLPDGSTKVHILNAGSQNAFEISGLLSECLGAAVNP